VYRIEDIFLYRMTGVENDRAVGGFYATGHEPYVFQRLAAAGFEMPVDLFAPRELGR
jgi:hypothetical protein